MNKKFISLAATAICTLSFSVTAFGAVNKPCELKLYSPSFSYSTITEKELSEKLNSCIERLKEKGIYCNTEIFENDLCKP